ncbi:hypothetical protein SESBI_28635 [Sesbania bispinosa]|nr:hypothetical protein SESBI_28635 [Sesbania bispinosa]
MQRLSHCSYPLSQSHPHTLTASHPAHHPPSSSPSRRRRCGHAFDLSSSPALATPSSSPPAPTTPSTSPLAPATPSSSPPAPPSRGGTTTSSPPSRTSPSPPNSLNRKTSSSNSSPPSSSSSNISTGVVVGIVVGAVVVLLALSILCICCKKKKRRRDEEYYVPPPPPQQPHRGPKGFTIILSGVTTKRNKISILAFEIANTIVKGVNLMQSLSKENIRNLKEVVLPFEGVQNLISRDMHELLRIAAADKREELKIFSGEVVWFGNRCKYPQWHNLDRYFEKLGSELKPQKQLKEEAKMVMQQLMTYVQYTVVSTPVIRNTAYACLLPQIYVLNS